MASRKAPASGRKYNAEQHKPKKPQDHPPRRKTQNGPAEDGQCQFDGEDYPTWLGYDPQKPGNPFKHPFPPIDGDPWEEAMHMIQKEDDALCDAWNAEIQNLLIFSGLFSAVVTAFAVETQKLLQDDPEVATVLLLAELGTHFLPNSTVTDKIADPFRSSPSDRQSFRINCFIFSSLIISLGTALVGIIVLQWIRSYRKPERSYDREGISLREARHQAFDKWGVPAIIAYLPVALGGSFIVFLVGLVDFLQTMNNVLAIVIGSFVLGIVVFLLVTTFLPAFHIIFFPSHPIPLCAYQSAQSMLCCRLLTKFSSIREWTELISEIHKERSTEQIRDRWLKNSLVAIFRRFNSAQSFRLAYHCFQSIPKNVSKNIDLRWKIVSEVLGDSTDLCKVGQGILKSIESSLPAVACTEVLSLLLLLWNRRLDPQYTGHRSELYFRCIQTFSRLKDSGENNPYTALINLWWQRSDTALSLTDGSRHWRSYLTTFLTTLQSDPSFAEEKRPLAFSLFWRLLAARIHDSTDESESLIVVQDCLRIITRWLLKIQNLPDKEYDAIESNQVLRHCLQNMIDYNVFTHTPLMVKLIEQQPSPFLQFLDVFLDPNHKRLKQGWQDAIESALADSWDEFIKECNLDQKYWTLARKNVSSARHSRFSESASSLAAALRSVSPEPQHGQDDSYEAEHDSEEIGLLARMKEDTRLEEVLTQSPPNTPRPMPVPIPFPVASHSTPRRHTDHGSIPDIQMDLFSESTYPTLSDNRPSRSASSPSSHTWER
ncbi:hypothetical protein CVT24_000222 [Panaeolus cyanescens]|uniref:DUF6535 domain-containing protein n=1 Tax=Panaeolus cyanescens TaxID=181874 RepID=A0A409VIR9_9AGAR|nr:hypothetical protein CVT24_000222 [Panaeolus cyanescens]